METQRHILFLTQAKPFSGFGGENMRSRGLISILQANNYSISAITASEGESIAEMNNLYAHYKMKDIQNSFCAKYNSLFRTDRRITSAINEVHQQKKIDVAFIDYMFMGQYISIFRKMGIPVIYGTHNAQADLTHQELITLSGITRFIRWGAWRLQRIHERRYFPKADRLIVVSENDARYHTEFCQKSNIIEIPNFLDPKDYPHYPNKENYLVISGNFSSYQNREGTAWFIKNVWIKSDFGDLSLMLAGYGAESFLNTLRQSRNLENAFASTSSDDIKEIIGKSRAAIVPLLQGSGSRFKILEALALGIPVISTTKGAEGINSPAIIIANSPLIFAQKIQHFGLETVGRVSLPIENSFNTMLKKLSIVLDSVITDN